MSTYWVNQSIGIIAFIIGVTVFLHRDEKKFKGQLAVYSTLIGVHFFMMGANAAGCSALLNTTRTVVSMYSRNTMFMAVFIALTLIFGLYNLKHPIELLPIIGTIISTWAFFKTRGLQTRYVVWSASACWAIHNIWIGSIGGSLIECCFVLMNAITIVRFRRMIKQGIDPFANVISAK